MTAPGIAQAAARRCARAAARLVVVDPRRTETAAHRRRAPLHPPRHRRAASCSRCCTSSSPRARVSLGGSRALTDGLDDVRALAARFPPERVAAAHRHRRRAHPRARARVRRRAVGGLLRPRRRVHAGVRRARRVADQRRSTSSPATSTAPGGAMFTTPAVDLVGVAAKLGERGHFGVWKSRVRGLPEFGGELPVAALAEEIETPGRGPDPRAGHASRATRCSRRPTARGSTRALAGARLHGRRSTSTSTRPRATPTSSCRRRSALEREHYDLVFHALAVRNTARYSPPLFDAAAGRAPRLADLLDLALGAARARRRPSRRASSCWMHPRAAGARAAAACSTWGCASVRTARLPLASGCAATLSGAARRRPRRRSSRACPGGCADARTSASSSRRAPFVADWRGSRRSSPTAPAPPADGELLAHRPPPPAQQQLVDAQQPAPREGPRRAARCSCTPTTRARRGLADGERVRGRARASARSRCRVEVTRRHDAAAWSACRTAGATAAPASRLRVAAGARRRQHQRPHRRAARRRAVAATPASAACRSPSAG